MTASKLHWIWPVSSLSGCDLPCFRRLWDVQPELHAADPQDHLHLKRVGFAASKSICAQLGD
jgi:hypothetical protein